MILTIAGHTFREVIRKKILHVLIGLGILIIIVSPFIPTTDEPDARVKMMLVVFFQVVVLLCIVGVIFLSATSLPHEIEDRTIYGILSKPISRLKIVAGKITGFALVSALVLVILGLVNIVAIQRVSSRLPEGYRGILKARNEFTASRFSIQGKSHHIRQGIVWIEGGRTGIALWSFSDLYKKLDNKSSLEVEFNLKLDSSRKDIDVIPLVVGIEDANVDQWKTSVLSAKIDEPLTLKIDPAIVGKSGAVNVTVFPIHSTDYIGVTQGDVKLFAVQNGFVYNYAKAIVITFLKFLLIISIAVMGSTYLSAPVSIASALVVLLCGHVLDFFKDFSLVIQRYDVHEHTLPAVLKKPNILLVYIDYLIKKPLEWFSFILPDFKRFDSLKFLLKGINIPLETVGASLGYTAIYAGICLFLASIIFKKREFF
ncbi:MAG: ABC transporter permease subunit [Candidatus Brocadiaceae bacterium]|uniref:ABC transporter permease subunit n=1 Tax=Candidatus Wunengus sp. YC61 TaxID=3367698 RepID=UPI00271EE6A9|nr:ABC transporter permease subunit [Candidatus Brocadiaceae bacterium]